MTSDDVIAHLETAETGDYGDALAAAAASSDVPNATAVFAAAAVTEVSAPVAYAVAEPEATPAPTPEPIPAGGRSKKKPKIRRSTAVSLGLCCGFIVLSFSLIRFASSDRRLSELRELREAQIKSADANSKAAAAFARKVAVAPPGPPEKIHPAVAVPIKDGSPANRSSKDAARARPAEASA